ncbi:DUF397 domain-containing protein [Saccharopolyspora mangrovi]|uniref:DUF397 domain-containing protein n=1 Tax=Saccharopolyspora mangrovi TaxID=3082379 RepID=A0ABU6AJJ1_9PSEU|nr:DUF397 domain-containing protein [Saccharopolyspora sp. S2-29]MEB3371596.1 DUF397 domain-containing protein [Saccharopolyspora sp. S2-29]
MTAAHSLAWRTSTRSSNGEKCVEVAPTSDGVVIRHSKHPEAGTIAFSRSEWEAFIGETCGSLSTPNRAATINQSGTDTVVRSLNNSAVELRFDEDEWSAFTAGAADGEFTFPTERASAGR